jgi:hypothetical protein
MTTWNRWKKSFDAWEDSAARSTEQVLRNPKLLSPVGTLFSAVMKARATTHKVMRVCWSAVGLPTREDQERTLHALHQIQSKLADIEERLAESKTSKH